MKKLKSLLCLLMVCAMMSCLCLSVMASDTETEEPEQEIQGTEFVAEAGSETVAEDAYQAPSTVAGDAYQAPSTVAGDAYKAPETVAEDTYEPEETVAEEVYEEPEVVYFATVAYQVYDDQDLVVDFNIKGDTTPVTVYLNGSQVNFTWEPNAVLSADSGLAMQGGVITVANQELIKYGKVNEVNTISAVFVVNGTDKTLQASSNFILISRVVDNKTEDSADKPAAAGGAKPAASTASVTNVSTPNTGDPFNPVVWVALLAAAMSGFAAVNVYSRKKIQ